VTPVLLGGFRQYQKLRKEVLTLLRDRTAYVTTMIDYYGLDKVKDFPKLRESMQVCNFRDRAKFLEDSLAENINATNFIPNIVVHEFEALLFSSPKGLASNLGIEQGQIDSILSLFNNDPEAINNSTATAPSKRIISISPRYQKVLQGNLTALEIGFDKIYARCDKFKGWIDRLEGLI
jgi:hypothetical protein